MLAQRAASEGQGGSGQVPSLLAERARSECARLGKRRVSARRGRAGEKVAQLRAALATPLKIDEESSKGHEQAWKDHLYHVLNAARQAFAGQ